MFIYLLYKFEEEKKMVNVDLRFGGRGVSFWLRGGLLSLYNVVWIIKCDIEFGFE